MAKEQAVAARKEGEGEKEKERDGERERKGGTEESAKVIETARRTVPEIRG